MGRLGDHLLDFSSSDRTSENVIGTQCNSTKGGTYVCSIGHCCENNECCSHYYELWWFWLIWSVAILLCCCCLYHQRQKRYHRSHCNRSRRRRHKEAYEGVCNYPGPPSENKILGSAKLPGYKDVIRIPPTSSPPPPYSSRRRPIHTIACLQPNDRGETSMSIIHCDITSSMLSVASLSHYIPEILAHNSIQPLPPFVRGDHEATDDNNNFHFSAVDEKQPFKDVCCEHCGDDSSPQSLHEDPNNNISSPPKFSTSGSPSDDCPNHSDDPLCHLLRHNSENTGEDVEGFQRREEDL